MTLDSESNSLALDAAYKPFPSFQEWSAQTHVETARWTVYLGQLDSRSNLDPEVLRRAREAAKRAAAIDTGAIEGLYNVDRGFTYTVAFETSAWESALSAKGEGVRSLFESQLHAYDFVLDLATKAEPISEAAIRRLHEEVCAAQSTYRVMTAVGPQEQPLRKGEYKALPNHVRTRKGAQHSYSPVDVTPDEMFRLVTQMRHEDFLKAHPVLQASYAHYCFTVIHPFADGNGRVARALASTFTYRAISMPIVILSEHKAPYLDSLESADIGDYQPFVDFMLARSLDTIRLVEESVRASVRPNVEEGMARLQSLFLTRGGMTQEAVDSAGERLAKLIQAELEAAISAIDSPRISGQVGREKVAHRFGNDRAYRLPIQGSLAITATLQLRPSGNPRVDRRFQLVVPKDAAESDELRIEEVYGEVAFSARIDEVLPEASGLLGIRAQVFAKRISGEILADVVSLAESAIRNTR